MINGGIQITIILSIALVLFIAIILIWTISIYNTFITLVERVNNAKAQVATQIESRWDAVKSLISATKKYSSYEAETLNAITEKRTNVGKESSIEDIQKDEAQYNHVMGRLIAVSENYPDLKASEIYQNTMDGITKFEDHVRGARMIYNDVVTKLNRKIKMFPSNIVANIFHFEEREYFQGTVSKQEMPEWD